ncbi:hypothetical protein GOP47_0004865 [Adiantum capillus-veneris]|uniref:Uncharacterized protein n=1 Tax=Adiantum capillus-veneris TaxID=13818 RepID=A0A9D4V4U9_ADICA|nr:hypothetical protein GOP47_0004865 [Adiantum capillus-veneris]
MVQAAARVTAIRAGASTGMETITARVITVPLCPTGMPTTTPTPMAPTTTPIPMAPLTTTAATGYVRYTPRPSDATSSSSPSLYCNTSTDYPGKSPASSYDNYRAGRQI